MCGVFAVCDDAVDAVPPTNLGEFLGDTISPAFADDIAEKENTHDGEQNGV